jgi:hypothetical protein
MGLVKRGKAAGPSEAEFAETVVSTKLWKADQAKFDELCRSHRKKPAEMLRLLVSQSLTHKELLAREAGGGGGREGVSRAVLHEVVGEQLRPVQQSIEGLKGYLAEIEARLSELPPAGLPPAATGVEGFAAPGDLTGRTDWGPGALASRVEGDADTRAECATRLGRERAEKYGQGTYALAARTSARVRAILDLLTRYVAVPQVLAAEQDMDDETALKEVADEIRLEENRGIEERRALERSLRIPRDEKLSALSLPFK